MDNDRVPAEPREQLDPNAKRIWVIGDLLGATLLVAFVLGATAFIRWVADVHWMLVVLPTGIALLAGVAWAVITPPIRYRQWRYEIRDDEVELLHGIVVRTHQIVPMARIQHVDTTRGPIQRRYGLASVVFYTAAGAMTIPELADARAADVRDRIAALAKVHDDLL